MEPQYDMRDLTGQVTETLTTVKNYPWEPWYNTVRRSDPNDPLYDVNGDGVADRWWEDGVPMEITVDVDGPDGLPDNPGQQVWQKPVRTDMKANQNFNLGLSATLSIPLNRKLQRQCHEAAQAQIDMNTQLVANKRLDFELARLKNCGDLKQKGIMFHPRSPYASICADVIVTQARPGSLPDHTHQLGSPSQEVTSDDSVPSSESESQNSDLSAALDVEQRKGLDQIFQGLSLPWQKSSSQEALLPSEVNPLGVWQVGQSSSQQQQSSQSSSQSED
tara:strand:+ start:526 stop:1353 length:828 start_codon:yes stop_codon:yes gene_type:complete